MNIRIDQEALSGARVSELSRSEDVGSSSAVRSNSLSGPGGLKADQVDISSLSGSIADSLSAAAAQQTSKVQHLAALYAAGRYNVDSLQVSRSMVSQALGPALLSGGQ
jgi:hypothetical protein